MLKMKRLSTIKKTQVVKPTDLVLDYVKDIKDLLKGE